MLDLDPFSFMALPADPGVASRQGARPLYGVDPAQLAYERLSSSFPGNVLRAVIIHEAPGHRNAPISHEGEELFFILSGALTVEIEGARHVLGPGTRSISRRGGFIRAGTTPPRWQPCCTSARWMFLTTVVPWPNTAAPTQPRNPTAYSAQVDGMS
ncbi:cupin domain-containing protein [Gemmobacter lanyuensis]